LWNALRKNGFLNWRASFYALAIDSKLKKEVTSRAIFDQAFFGRPKRAAVEVKDFYKEMTPSQEQRQSYDNQQLPLQAHS